MNIKLTGRKTRTCEKCGSEYIVSIYKKSCYQCTDNDCKNCDVDNNSTYEVGECTYCFDEKE